jgi:hypothetical protein
MLGRWLILILIERRVLKIADAVVLMTVRVLSKSIHGHCMMGLAWARDATSQA